MLIRRFFAFIISAFLVFFPAYSYAASPVGWSASPADIVMNGATATVTAIKGAGSSALQSTVKHAPTAANIGKKLLKGGGTAALLLAVPQIIGEGVDWVLDPANNGVKYFPMKQRFTTYLYGGRTELTKEKACAYSVSMVAANTAGGYSRVVNGGITLTGNSLSCRILAYRASAPNSPLEFFHDWSLSQVPDEPKILPIDTVAAKVQSNAAAGHAPSQELIKTVVIDDVNSGALDVPFNIAAVPQADAPPIADPNAPPVDPNAPPVPFDPSSIIAAIKSVMAAVVNMSGILSAKIDALMIDLGLKHDEKLAADAANTAEIVAANDRTGAQVAAIAAAVADIEGNTLDGKVINDAVDRAIAAGHTDTASIVAAIEAIEGNTLDGKVINDAVDRVIANDNVNAQSAAEAAEAAAEAAEVAEAANTAAVTDAIEAQTDAISETDPVTGAKSLKLPAFCSWALPVCDFFGWVAEPVPDDEEKEEVGFATTGDVGLDDVDRFEKRITFSGQCPSNEFSFSMMGVTYAKPIPYHHLCGFLEQIAPWLLAMCYLGTAYFVVENI